MYVPTLSMFLRPILTVTAVWNTGETGDIHIQTFINPWGSLVVSPAEVGSHSSKLKPVKQQVESFVKVRMFYFSGKSENFISKNKFLDK